jgi:hypothetical protein
MLEAVIARLASFGYTEITTNDQAMLDFEIEKVTWTVKNDCNVSEIPEGLVNIAVDMVCGHFLQAKKTTSPSDLADLIDFDSAVIKEITAGDTKTVWENSGTQSNEQRYDAFCDYLINYGCDEFSCYRRLRW